jgi:hypothetical protein
MKAHQHHLLSKFWTKKAGYHISDFLLFDATVRWLIFNFYEAVYVF